MKTKSSVISNYEDLFHTFYFDSKASFCLFKERSQTSKIGFQQKKPINKG